VIIGIVASVFALAGCGGESTTPQSDSPSGATASPIPADSTGRMQIGPLTPPSFTVSVPVTGLPPHDEYTPTIAVDDVRIEADADTATDRIVYRFTGTGVPFWKVGYVAEAIPYRGGPSLGVTGQAIMQIDIMGTATPNLSSAAAPLAGPEGSRVTHLFLLPDARDVDGTTQSFVGLRTGPRPFEVVAVEDPPQLIIEIR